MPSDKLKQKTEGDKMSRVFPNYCVTHDVYVMVYLLKRLKVSKP